MPRVRDQFTGHVWIKSLTTDKRVGNAAVWEILPVATNIDFLTTLRYFCLIEREGMVYRLSVYPRSDVPPPAFARIAARYESCGLPGCLQAASNDYGHIFGRTAQAEVRQGAQTRLVDYMESGDPCLAVK